MSSITRSHRPDSVPPPLKGTNNIGNLPALGPKTQNSSIVEATVSEIRPGGDVILATPQGLIRTSTTLALVPEEKVLARLTGTEEAEMITATIINKISTLPNKTTETTGVSLFKKYIHNFIFGTSSEENLEKPVSEPIIANVSYLIPNRNILKYGHIKPGDKISIQILSPDTDLHGIDIVSGEVVSNNGKLLNVNTSIGIINISAKSNFLEGDKILFSVLETPSKRSAVGIQSSLESFLELVSNNMQLLKSIFRAIKDIDNAENYQKLLNLIASQHDTATLAKLFYQARTVPEKDVERWIKEEIVEPFEASNKGNRLGFIGQEMAKIGKQLEQLRILPEAVWQYVPIFIPGTEERFNAKVKKDKTGAVNFVIEVDQAELGKIILQGLIEMRTQDRHLINLTLNIKYSKDFPETLSTLIASSFAEQKIYSGIDGAIHFEKIE